MVKASLLKHILLMRQMNMIHPIIKYYTDFQNHHVKHNDSVNKNEMEYVVELTSVIMKFVTIQSSHKII